MTEVYIASMDKSSTLLRKRGIYHYLEMEISLQIFQPKPLTEVFQCNVATLASYPVSPTFISCDDSEADSCSSRKGEKIWQK